MTVFFHIKLYMKYKQDTVRSAQDVYSKEKIGLIKQGRNKKQDLL